MDIPASIEAIVIIALVLAPGYVFTRTITRVINQVEEPPDLRFLVTIITWGLLIQALLFLIPWPKQVIGRRQVLDFYRSRTLPAHPVEIVRWAIISVAVIPWVLGQLIAHLLKIRQVDDVMDWFGFSIVDRTPTAWQHVTNKEESAYYVRVYLKEGDIIGGCYAKKSFASNNPRHGDIYLEQRIGLDENNELRSAIPHSEGVWIAHDVISHIELFGETLFEGANEGHASKSLQSSKQPIAGSSPATNTSRRGPRKPAQKAFETRAPASSEALDGRQATRAVKKGSVMTSPSKSVPTSPPKRQPPSKPGNQPKKRLLPPPPPPPRPDNQ